MTEVFNRNGGLTLIPMPGYEEVVSELREMIEGMSKTTAHGTLTSTVDIAAPEFVQYDNGEMTVYLEKQHVVGHDCIIIGSGPADPTMEVQLYELADVVSGRKPSHISFFFGYLPKSRSDKPEGTQGFPACRRFLDTLIYNAGGPPVFKRILATDLHAEQLPGFARSGQVTPVTIMRPLIGDVLEEAVQTGFEITIVYPDDGARKRYKSLVTEVAAARDIKVNHVTDDKERNKSSIAIKGVFGDIHAMKDGLLIVIDDEIATGGTNIKTATRLMQDHHPAKIWSVAIHGVFCKAAATTLSHPQSPIDRIFVTDTIRMNREHLQPLKDSGKLTVVSWLKHLAEMIFFDHWDINIRETR